MTPQMVEYDITRSEGTVVCINPADQVVTPAALGGLPRTFVWYAGDLKDNMQIVGNQRRVEIVATPVEFGGGNITPADQVKQGQKALIGSLVVEPVGATYPDALATLDRVPDNQGTGTATRGTRAQATVSTPAANSIPALGVGGTFREAVMVPQKALNFRWKDGTAIRNVKQGELGREGAEDAGHQAVNYAAEPGWFRFKLPPDAPFGNAGTPNSFGALDQDRYFANALVTAEPNAVPAIAGVSAAGDPATPVFRAPRFAGGQAAEKVSNLRIHMLTPFGTDRDSTLHIAGHLWQRDPFVCTGAARDVAGTTLNVVQDAQDPAVLLPGRCDPRANVVSTALGYNMQGKWMGGEEGMGHGYGHWPILTKAGGTDGVQGDYLFKAWESWGNVNGMWGLLRVTP
jgi:hypothetical protein